jgi:hypothetical protein
MRIATTEINYNIELILIIMNSELGRIWKEAVMASFKVLSQYLSGGTTENYEKLQSG